MWSIFNLILKWEWHYKSIQIVSVSVFDGAMALFHIYSSGWLKRNLETLNRIQNILYPALSINDRLCCMSCHVSTLNRPYRMTCQNFGKANRLGYVKILILFMTKVVDIFILKTGARNEDFLQPWGRRLESLTAIVMPFF